MRKGVISLICCAAVLLPLILSGCSNAADTELPTEPAIPIVLKEQIPSAAVMLPMICLH